MSRRSDITIVTGTPDWERGDRVTRDGAVWIVHTVVRDSERATITCAYAYDAS